MIDIPVMHEQKTLVNLATHLALVLNLLVGNIAPCVLATSHFYGEYTWQNIRYDFVCPQFLADFSQRSMQLYALIMYGYIRTLSVIASNSAITLIEF